MRWKPDVDPCPECGFAWSVSPHEAVAVVAESPRRIAPLMDVPERVTKRPAPGVWSPSEYLWHLVDVLRIGRERLLTILLDPAAGIPCWDENDLAAARRYSLLSPTVGAVAYEDAVRDWLVVTKKVDAERSVQHPQYGTLTAGDIMRRNAHEVRHHEMDIRRGSEGPR